MISSRQRRQASQAAQGIARSAHPSFRPARFAARQRQVGRVSARSGGQYRKAGQAEGEIGHEEAPMAEAVASATGFGGIRRKTQEIQSASIR